METQSGHHGDPDLYRRSLCLLVPKCQRSSPPPFLRVKEVVAAVEIGQNTLGITCDRFSTCIDVSYGEKETVLSVCVLDKSGAAESPRDTKLAHLAFLLFPLSLNLPATYLIWPLSDVQIPRQRFVDGLAECFRPDKPQPDSTIPTKEALPDEEELRSMIRQASYSLQANPRARRAGSAPCAEIGF